MGPQRRKHALADGVYLIADILRKVVDALGLEFRRSLYRHLQRRKNILRPLHLPCLSAVVHAQEMNGYEPGAIWPTFDYDDVQVREVYSRYGLAMFMAQVLEHGMVNALIVLRLLPTLREHAHRSSWDEAFGRFYDAELAKTFGNMVRALEQTDAFSPDLLGRLRSAKVQRDHLAHRFFREHDLDFMTRPGREKMIVECDKLIELFKGIDREVEAIVSPQRSRFGITPEWIDEHVALMEAQAQRMTQGAAD